MKLVLKQICGLVVVMMVLGFVMFHFYWDTTVKYGSMAINYVRYMSAPKGILITEMSFTYKDIDSHGSTSTAMASDNAATAAKSPSLKKALRRSRARVQPKVQPPPTWVSTGEATITRSGQTDSPRSRKSTQITRTN